MVDQIRAPESPRAMAAALPDAVSLVATDLNQPMLQQAMALGTTRPVEWRQADATQLPFEDGTFGPADPPRFMARTPHGYPDPVAILRDVAGGGFAATAELTTVTARSRADSAEEPAVGYCQGTPLRNEIEAREPGGLVRATEYAAEAVARRFGTGPVDGKIQAHVVAVEK